MENFHCEPDKPDCFGNYDDANVPCHNCHSWVTCRPKSPTIAHVSKKDKIATLEKQNRELEKFKAVFTAEGQKYGCFGAFNKGFKACVACCPLTELCKALAEKEEVCEYCRNEGTEFYPICPECNGSGKKIKEIR